MAPRHQLLLSNKTTASVLSLQQRAPCKCKPNARMKPTRSFIMLLSYLPRISPSSRQEVLPGRTSIFPGGSLRAAPRLSAGSKVLLGGREPPIAASLAFWPKQGTNEGLCSPVSRRGAVPCPLPARHPPAPGSSAVLQVSHFTQPRRNAASHGSSCEAKKYLYYVQGKEKGPNSPWAVIMEVRNVVQCLCRRKS